MTQKVLRRLAAGAIAAAVLTLLPPATAGAIPGPAEPLTFPYSVSPGDQLWYFARRYGTSVAAIRAASGLTSDRIHPGQILLIPAGQPDYPGTSGFLYRVWPGDRL